MKHIPVSFCPECRKTGKKLRSLIPNSEISELSLPLLEPNEELNLDLAGLLDSHWEVNKHILFRVGRFENFLRQKLHLLHPHKLLSSLFEITYSFTAYLTQLE